MIGNSSKTLKGHLPTNKHLIVATLFRTQPQDMIQIPHWQLDDFPPFCIIIVSVTVLLYDHLLSIADEIEYIWKKRVTPFSLLFLLNRYLAMVGMGIYLTFTFINVSHANGSVPASSGEGFYPIIILVITSVITCAVAEVMLILMVYVVFARNRSILLFLLSIWAIQLALTSFVIYQISPSLMFVPVDDEKPWYWTFLELRIPTGVIFVLPAFAFGVVAGGFLTFGVYRTFGSMRSNMPLVRLIIRDGLLYFAVVCVTNTAWLSANHLGSYISHSRAHERVTQHKNMNFIPLEVWSTYITTTMIGRMTLNLRTYDPAANDSEELSFGDITQSLRFHHSVNPYTTDNER